MIRHLRTVLAQVLNVMTPKFAVTGTQWRGMPLRVRLTKGFGLTASQGGLLPTTDMPDGQDIYRVVRDPVVDEVPNAAYKQAPDARKARSRIFGADSGLLGQQRKALPYVVSDCTRRRRSVLGPPRRGGSDVIRGAR
jgi:hypothetical protein